jgi:hypothetical protein
MGKNQNSGFAPKPLLRNEEVIPNEVKPKVTEKLNKPKSVQTLYKSMMTNLVRLTRVADQKAALMISVNSVIISFAVSFTLSKSTEFPFLLTPTIIL